MRRLLPVALFGAATVFAPRASALDHVEADAALGFALPRTFTSTSRTTPAWSDSSLDATAVHAWLLAAIDARLSF